MGVDAIGPPPPAPPRPHRRDREQGPLQRLHRRLQGRHDGRAVWADVGRVRQAAGVWSDLSTRWSGAPSRLPALPRPYTSSAVEAAGALGASGASGVAACSSLTSSDGGAGGRSAVELAGCAARSASWCAVGSAPSCAVGSATRAAVGGSIAARRRVLLARNWIRGHICGGQVCGRCVEAAAVDAWTLRRCCCGRVDAWTLGRCGAAAVDAWTLRRCCCGRVDATAVDAAVDNKAVDNAAVPVETAKRRCEALSRSGRRRSLSSRRGRCHPWSLLSAVAAVRRTRHHAGSCGADPVA